MKLKKVASLLLSGVMLLSQPAYAAGEVNEVVETDVAGEEESLREDTNTDNMGEINVSNETANQEALDSTSSVLSWNGTFYQNQNAEINVSYESGDDIGALGALPLDDLSKEAETEICKKIESQMINVSVRGIKCFSLNTENKSQASYKINIVMQDASDFRNTELYHIAENGESEKLTYTIENTDDGRQRIAFVSSGGLGDFAFVSISDLSDITMEEPGVPGIPEADGSTSETDGDSGDMSDLTISDSTEDTSENEDITVNDNIDSDESDSNMVDNSGDADSSGDLTVNDSDKMAIGETESQDSESSDNTDKQNEDVIDSASTEKSTDTTDNNTPGDSVEPVSIDNFKVLFVSGADNIDGQNVWNPSDPAAGHSFIYRTEYTMSGKFSTDIGAFKIEVPLHILKDKDGNWADTFHCPYRLSSELSENDVPDFVYDIDEENNKVTIYNYKSYPTGTSGYIEFAYETTKETTEYTDMSVSENVHAKVYATNENSTVTADATADGVYIDTHATIAYTQKKKPTLYRSWNKAWGETPTDAGNYYYLVWPIKTYVNKNTSCYSFTLNDTCTDMKSSVIGYRFSGQSSFSDINSIDNVKTYGDRYDYVLTRYSKADADAISKDAGRFYIHNDIEAIVSPSDHVDIDTNATSSYDWFYESPVYIYGKGDFWAEKYGIYGEYNKVESSEDISNYVLGEFEEGDIDTLPNLKYRVIGDGRPSAYTIEDGGTGEVEDAINDMFWKKKVDYNITDDGIAIEGTALNDNDYDVSKAELKTLIKEAVFDETTYEFKTSKKTLGFNEDDNISVSVRTAEGWNQAAVYDLNSKAYKDINEKYIKSASGRTLTFNAGVKALKYLCSHAYYYTELNVYPEISLFRTEHVQEILKNKPTKIAVQNNAKFLVSQGDNVILDRDTQASDYVQKVERESEIKKDIVKTENLKKESRFEVTWNVSFQEKYVDDDGIHYIYQDSGKFYDLLPLGSNFDPSSLTVSESSVVLTRGEYDYSLTENYRNSGRTLLTISIAMPTKNQYSVKYNTSHDYDSVNDYGRNLLNSVVYESGNNRIGNGRPDDGGNISDKNILSDINPDTDEKKFAYAEARYEVNFPVAASTGLKKQVKNSTSSTYSYNEVIHKNEDYSYKIRLTNDSTTKATDIIFFDSLENFYQDEDQTEPIKVSDWKGKFQGLNLAQFVYKGAAPVIYYSKIESLNPQKHNDLKEKTKDGEPIWIEASKFERQFGLDKVRAIAIDATKCEDGSDFMLDESESVSFIIYMQAPDEDTSDKQDPVAYNNIFVNRTAIKKVGNEIVRIPQFYHQDYTQAHYRISGDLDFMKVDATDASNVIHGITYKLTGTSDYGTAYDEERTSNKYGKLSFREIEKGTYQLKETLCSEDWQLNKETYTVKINSKGETAIDGLKNEDGVYILEDEPRSHADVIFQKIDNVTGSQVEGAVFKLSGVSDYGNEYTLYGTSNKIGRITFKNIELGKYDLVEVQAPDGYIKNGQKYSVNIDENNRAYIYDSDGNEINANSNRLYQIENEPYHSVRFLKSSTYGENIYLEGAEFNLSGISDYGTSVNMNAVSGRAEDGGLVVFDGLEPGTYTLKETKAPAGHYIDEKLYDVVVNKNGTFTIDGLEKVQFGNKE